MRLTADEANAWIDAGTWHDALRDAPIAELRGWERLFQTFGHDRQRRRDDAIDLLLGKRVLLSVEIAAHDKVIRAGTP